MQPDEIDCLIRLIASEDLPGKHLEVGTARGITLCAMVQALRSPHDPAFVVVDNMRYFPDQIRLIRDNLERFGVDPDSIEFRIGDSRKVFRKAQEAGDSFDAQAGSLLALRKRGESATPEVPVIDRLWAMMWSIVLRFRK